MFTKSFQTTLEFPLVPVSSCVKSVRRMVAAYLEADSQGLILAMPGDGIEEDTPVGDDVKIKEVLEIQSEWHYFTI